MPLPLALLSSILPGIAAEGAIGAGATGAGAESLMSASPGGSGGKGGPGGMAEMLGMAGGGGGGAVPGTNYASSLSQTQSLPGADFSKAGFGHDQFGDAAHTTLPGLMQMAMGPGVTQDPNRQLNRQYQDPYILSLMDY